MEDTIELIVLRQDYQEYKHQLEEFDIQTSLSTNNTNRKRIRKNMLINIKGLKREITLLQNSSQSSTSAHLTIIKNDKQK